MHWVLATVFGVIGGAVGYCFIGDPVLGGSVGRQVGVYSAAIGFIVAAPVGYLIGSLPFLTPQAPLPEPPKQFAPQVAGAVCAVCGEKIIFAGDGTSCALCDRVFHLACTEKGNCPSC